MNFDVSLESLFEPFSISTPIGESVIAKRINRNIPIMVLYGVILADLIKLEMINLDFIICMDWLHALVDC